MAPVVEHLSDQYRGTVDFVRVNIDESPQTARRYGISSIPTIAVFNNGRSVDSITGAVPEQELTAMISRAISQHVSSTR